MFDIDNNNFGYTLQEIRFGDPQKISKKGKDSNKYLMFPKVIGVNDNKKVKNKEYAFNLLSKDQT